MKKRRLSKFIKIILLICIIIFFILFYRHSIIFKEIINLIAISFLIAYALRPVFKIMVKRGMNKRLSGVELILIVIIILCGTICLIIPAIFKESLNINNTIKIMQKTADDFYSKIKLLSSNKTFYKVLDDLSGKANNYISLFFSNLLKGVVNLGKNFLNILVIPIISYYFLVDSEYFKKIFLSLFPINMRNASEKVMDDIDKILGRYIVSQVFLSVIISLCTFIILAFIKVDYPVILSVLNGFFNIIPYFGPIFGAVPAILIALLKSPKSALYTAVWLYILQTVEGNILSPKITGDSISMHPFFVIILLILGGRVGGIAGMLLSVPIGAAVVVIMDDINYYLF